LTRYQHAAVVSLATAVSLFGCGDNLAGPDAAIDVVRPDAAPCPLPADGYGTLVFDSTRASRVRDSAGKETVAWLGSLQAGPFGDLLDIQLIEGHGAFASGPPGPGTYPLTGVERQLATCGICIVLEVGSPRQYVVAQGGTLVIDELGPTGTGRFRATLMNAPFARVLVDPMTTHSTVLNDGCETSITTTSWDTPIN
jgi:hypothetical protein